MRKGWKDYLTKLKTLLDSVGIPVAYDAFPVEVRVSMPFIIYYNTNSNNFIADNKVYKKINHTIIEFYSRTRDLTTEGTIESKLDVFVWTKNVEYDADQKCHITTYEIEF